MGRNNERSPEGSLKVSNDYDRIIKQNNMIYQSWIENCLISRAKTDVSAKMVRNRDIIKVGDIVIFEA